MKSTSRGAADMPLVLTSGKYLYRATITLYMFDMAPPVNRFISTAPKLNVLAKGKVQPTRKCHNLLIPWLIVCITYGIFIRLCLLGYVCNGDISSFSLLWTSLPGEKSPSPSGHPMISLIFLRVSCSIRTNTGAISYVNLKNPWRPDLVSWDLNQKDWNGIFL